ncbi:MAG TPA: hypothetical protein VNS80_06790, partial [Pseudolysinimonas sp.]|nr:hypothetical protein [Pseudolysinimonas sp.]
GVIVQQPLIGVLGFAVMFVGALLGFAPPRRLTAARGEASSRRSLMDTLGERWEQRGDPED